ncbi:odorant receptor 226 [Tribolium castaneum]|uniref:Odorant receptor n=1 Tax=Tribolium castaneum TaxID=7070 RepID=D6WHM1_TRICA|nr:odorant receptor 226 [Tribolium castaneum]
MAKTGDPFIMLRWILLMDVSNNKITKYCNIFLTTVYSLVLCLQIYYILKNYDINLLIKYGPITTLLLFMITVAVISLLLQKEIFETDTFIRETCWPLNIIQKSGQIKAERKCRTINFYIGSTFLLFLSVLILNYPCFGSQRDFFICIEMFEEYFGEWSSVFYYLYFIGSHFLYYRLFQTSYLFVYGMLEANLQFFLIEEYLLQTYQTDCLKRCKYLQDTRYQQEIGKSLRFCIKHHIALKKLVKMVVNLGVLAMPFFLVFGVLLLISCFTFITNFADTMSNILKIRIFMFVSSTVAIALLLCWIGQQLIDVTSDIFFTLGGAPWYNWNLDNIKLLLMFITNCTKNESMVLAGIRADYDLFVSLLRISASYALVLLKLRKCTFV